MDYSQAMQFIRGFTRSGTPVNHLGRMSALLDVLGNPQKKLRFIHIAGTNGKGSVAEYLFCMLECAGYRTGCFTSPHIREYADRIRINHQNIPADDLCRLCERIAAVTPDTACSQFEISLAIALLYFVQEQTDYVILEAGIGGLLDATNVIEKPLVSILTSVSKDHMQILGNTIPEIAAQKAGIIKPDCPVVVSPGNHAAQIFRETAAARHAACYIPDMQDCTIQSSNLSGNRFIYRNQTFHTRMGGLHQIENALTALTAAEILTESGICHMPVPVMQKALAQAAVPARIQLLQENPPVILDGGHNADGIGVLTDLLSESEVHSWIGICGMTDTKDADVAAFQLALILSRVLCVDGFSENSLPKEQLQQAFTRQHAIASGMDLQKALPYALQWAEGSHGGVVICGSLYLASWYLQFIEPEQKPEQEPEQKTEQNTELNTEQGR